MEQKILSPIDGNPDLCFESTDDSTGGSTASGSLLWDATNDYWKGGTKGGGSIFTKLLDMDGDGSMMDDLLNIGMKILKK